MPMVRATAAVVALALSVPVLAVAQARTPDPRDVGTIDGIMLAFYEVISGPPGQPRDWGRDSTLYIPGVRFVALSERNGQPRANIMDHEAYVRQSEPVFVRDGFFEEEIGREVRRFGNLASVLSSYATRATADGPVTGRGVNSIQMYWDGQRWWITGVVWDGERPGNPLPAELTRPPEDAPGPGW